MVARLQHEGDRRVELAQGLLEGRPLRGDDARILLAGPRVGEVARDEQEARAQPVDVVDRQLEHRQLLRPRLVHVQHAQLRVGELHEVVLARPRALRLATQPVVAAVERELEPSVVRSERGREPPAQRLHRLLHLRLRPHRRRRRRLRSDLGGRPRAELDGLEQARLR